jgi:hypothetical protein
VVATTAFTGGQQQGQTPRPQLGGYPTLLPTARSSVNQNEHRQQSSLSTGGGSGYNDPQQSFLLPGYGYVSPEASDRGSRLKQRSQKFRTPPPVMFYLLVYFNHSYIQFGIIFFLNFQGQVGEIQVDLSTWNQGRSTS